MPQQTSIAAKVCRNLNHSKGPDLKTQESVASSRDSVFQESHNHAQTLSYKNFSKKKGFHQLQKTLDK
jgi:hypothetical protein